MRKTSICNIDKVASCLPDDFLLLIGKLQAMSNEELLTDDELARFFKLVEPAQVAAREAAQACAKEAGRTATQAELRAAGLKGLLAEAPGAASEVWGAAIGELFGGKPPQ